MIIKGTDVCIEEVADALETAKHTEHIFVVNSISTMMNQTVAELLAEYDTHPIKDSVFEKEWHWPAPKRQSKPKNTHKQHIRSTMRSINRNR